LFVITFATSIPPFVYHYVPVLYDPRYIVGAGADTRVLTGAFLELLLIIANIGTAIVLFPILKRQNETLALGYVTARVVECVFIAGGILSLLTVVTLSALAVVELNKGAPNCSATCWKMSVRNSRTPNRRANSCEQTSIELSPSVTT
jgi:Domain of unknown function (DUF4386)